MSRPDIEGIAAREAAATPGPWEDAAGFNNAGCPILCFKIPAHNAGATVEMLEDDVEFIKHARADVPALVAYVARLERERDEAQAKVARYEAHFGVFV